MVGYVNVEERVDADFSHHGVEWMDADVTEFRVPSGTPSPPEPARPRTVEETKEHPRPNEPPARGDTKVCGSMMDFETWKQRREEMLREAEQNRLAKVLRDSRKRRGAGRTSALAWELNRAAGVLRKLLRSPKRHD